MVPAGEDEELALDLARHQFAERRVWMLLCPVVPLLDAAVATALALAVTHPAAGNIGGGGYLLVARVDFRRPPARGDRIRLAVEPDEGLVSRTAAMLAELGYWGLAQVDFVATASHEFRTPLTLMLGPMEDALRTTDRALGGDQLQRGRGQLDRGVQPPGGDQPEHGHGLGAATTSSAQIPDERSRPRCGNPWPGCIGFPQSAKE